MCLFSGICWVSQTVMTRWREMDNNARERPRVIWVILYLSLLNLSNLHTALVHRLPPAHSFLLVFTPRHLADEVSSWSSLPEQQHNLMIVLNADLRHTFVPKKPFVSFLFPCIFYYHWSCYPLLMFVKHIVLPLCVKYTVNKVWFDSLNLSPWDSRQPSPPMSETVAVFPSGGKILTNILTQFNMLPFQSATHLFVDNDI